LLVSRDPVPFAWMMMRVLTLRTGINSNYGDTATFKDIKVSGVKEICDEYTGTDDNDVEPAKVGSGPSDACIYSESDITES
jgi:hypothetical protein